jgi:phosphohistidine phosphatase SixA
MHKLAFVVTIAIFLTSCSRTYYIVRHAEKAVPSPGTTMSTPDDPPLSDQGKARAQALKEVLKDKNIASIYSTNTVRTRTTAEPLSQHTGVSIQTYGPRPDSTFINSLKNSNGNVLVVGHSNTVDDIVNGLVNQKKLSDLADSEYNNLFVIKYKRFFGTRIKYEGRQY